MPDDRERMDDINAATERHLNRAPKPLQHAVRESTEILATEAAASLIADGLVTESDIDAKELAADCLRFTFRLLCLFYVEDHPELGVPKEDAALVLASIGPRFVYLERVQFKEETLKKVFALLSEAKAQSPVFDVWLFGRVYENLINFTGMITPEDMIEVRPAKGVKDRRQDDDEDLSEEDEAA